MVESISSVIEVIRRVGRKALLDKYAQRDLQARQQLEKELAPSFEDRRRCFDIIQTAKSSGLNEVYLNDRDITIMQGQSEFVPALDYLWPDVSPKEDNFAGIFHEVRIMRVPQPPEPPPAEHGPGYTTVMR